MMIFAYLISHKIKKKDMKDNHSSSFHFSSTPTKMDGAPSAPSAAAAAAADASETTITLVSGDDHVFVVKHSLIMKSEMVKALYNDIAGVSSIPVKNVSGTILAKVIEYLQIDAEKEANKWADDSAEFKKLTDEFVKVDQSTLFELILAANYMNIKELLDLTCLTVANMIKGKTPEEIRTTFNIKNDFTAEEEEEVRRENQWAFE